MTSTRRVGRLALADIDPSSQIVLQAKLEQLRELAHWVGQIGAQFQLPAALVHRIDICLTELVTNLISYGYADGRIGTVKIRFWRQPECIVIRVDDDGAHFNPTSYEPPGLPTSLADAPIGGRGIRLVRHFSDDLQYIVESTGNHLLLVFQAGANGTKAAAAESAVNAASDRDR